MRHSTRATAFALVICFLFSLIVQVQAASTSPSFQTPNPLDLTFRKKTAPTSFCKCTCFKKSMIIPLDAPNNAGTASKSDKRSPLSSPDFPHRDTDDEDDLPSAASSPPPEKIPYKRKTCSDCNKSFCLDLGLPDCKDATEEDVVTSCFREFSFLFCLSMGKRRRVGSVYL